MTGIFPPGKLPPEGSTPVVFPPNEAWLCEICRWREPVPTRVLNPNASEASYKPKQRSYKPKKYSVLSGGNIPLGEYTGVECSGGEYTQNLALHIDTTQYIIYPIAL